MVDNGFFFSFLYDYAHHSMRGFLKVCQCCSCTIYIYICIFISIYLYLENASHINIILIYVVL